MSGFYDGTNYNPNYNANSMDSWVNFNLGGFNRPTQSSVGGINSLGYTPKFDYGFNSNNQGTLNSGYNFNLPDWKNQISTGVHNDLVNALLHSNGGNQINQPNMLQTLFGGKDNMGVVPGVLGGLGSLAQGWLGFQNLKLAKDQFNAQQDAYRTNLRNQARLTNADLLERQKTRWENNPDDYEKPDDAWKKKNLLPES